MALCLATTGCTAIVRHFAWCDILPRSGWPTESRRAGLAKNIETLTNWSRFVHTMKSRSRLTGNGHLDGDRRNLDRVG